MKDYFLKKIAFLIPSRNRANDIIEVVNNLIVKTKDLKNIEILVKLDDDDFVSIETLNNALKPYVNNLVKVVVSPRKRGYLDMHQHYYELALHSNSEWLFIYSDDIRMETQDYDQIFQELSEQIKIIQCYGNNNGNWCQPIVHTKIIQILEHFSVDTPYLDGWLKTIGERLNLNITLPVHYKHLVDVTPNDETKIEKEAINNGPGRNFDWNFHIENSSGLIYNDILKLKEALNL